MTERLRFRGQIAGVGSTSGIRVVLGHWTDTPFGAFDDAMVETANGHRVLIAPHRDAADFIAATYTFDEIRIEPIQVTPESDSHSWDVFCPSLSIRMGFGRRTALGWALRAVPRRLAASPSWCTLTDPLARALLRGVRTRGTAGNGRREWYGATDVRRVVTMAGRFEQTDLGRLADVDPPCRFGFSSTPRRPSVTTVVTTVGPATVGR